MKQGCIAHMNRTREDWALEDKVASLSRIEPEDLAFVNKAAWPK